MLTFYTAAACVLNKVFNENRLYTEITPAMVQLLMTEREREKSRADGIIDRIRKILIDSDYECDRTAILKGSEKKEVIISGRIKTIVSAMYNLVATKNGHHQDLNDMLGLMLICEDEATCYTIRNLLIEKLVANGDVIISEKDMIANPKRNGYQSIHIHIDADGIVYEIQIKSHKMFAFSQTGDCKHDLYKRHLNTVMLQPEERVIFDSLKEEYWI